MTTGAPSPPALPEPVTTGFDDAEPFEFPPEEDGHHPSLVLHAPGPDDVERVWKEHWFPIVREGGMDALKRELFDYDFLVDQARVVYRHVTGGLCDDLCASADGIIAEADRRLQEAIKDAFEEYHARHVPEKRAKARGV